MVRVIGVGADIDKVVIAYQQLGFYDDGKAKASLKKWTKDWDLG